MSSASDATVSPSDIPPPNFTVMVSMFSSQAAVALGMIPHPVTKQRKPEPHLGRHFIDMLSILEEKTRGNLTAQEADFLEKTLHQLRIAFLQVNGGKG